MEFKQSTRTRMNSASSALSAVKSARSRGSAMIEMVLTLPLVLVVLSLLFFFGLSMTRLQRSSVTDRYEAWRQVVYAPGPGAEFAKNPAGFGDADLLNEAFFAGNASSLTLADRAGRVNVDEPVDLVAQAAGAIYPGAEDFIREQMRRAPAWWRVDLATEHTSSVPLYQRFAGQVRHQHTRIDGDWAFASWIEQLNPGDREALHRTLDEDVHFIGDNNDKNGLMDLDDLRAEAMDGLYFVYFQEFDDQLQAMQDSGNTLADSARGIYLIVPQYAGPTVLPERDIHLLRIVPNPNPDPGETLE